MTDLICSAKGCRASARWAVRWNNPRLHTPNRRKTWLACAEHREHLENFLSARSFHQETIPVADLPAADRPAGPPESGGPAAQDRR